MGTTTRRCNTCKKDTKHRMNLSGDYRCTVCNNTIHDGNAPGH